ncbi:MAG: hypothetical protein OXC12_14190 [Spirochaetaceae bacterium]|nr:hypothetical protein [Spirochaetaceae bacterium]
MAEDFAEQFAQGREPHRLGRVFQFGGLHQSAVDALGKPLQVSAAGKKQRPLGTRRSDTRVGEAHPAGDRAGGPSLGR